MKILSEVKDNRRRQGLRYEPVHILLFSVSAVLSGADSYRKIHSFTETHYEVLNDISDPNRKKIPAYTTVRNIICGVSADSLENAFGKHSIRPAENTEKISFIAFDGRVLRGSSDHFNDKKAVQCLSAFMTDSRIITAQQPAGKPKQRQMGFPQPGN